MPSSRLRSLAIAGREALAFARQALLLPRDAAPVLPRDVADGDDVVVFVHGLFATAGVLRPLREAVTRVPRVHAASLTVPPGPGVEALATRVGAVIGALPAAARVHLVGHSLGGIVARAFAETRRDARLVQTISLAAPFAGVARAGLLGFDGARDLAADSALLRAIRLGTSALPHLSILAGADPIAGGLEHALPGGEVHVVADVGHNALLYHPEVAILVAQRVVAAR